MYNILWLDDEFVINGKLHDLKKSLEELISYNNSDDVVIE